MASYVYGDRKAPELFVAESDYVFGVESAEIKLSKAGNEQIELKLRILLDGGKEGPLVYDYLGFDEKFAWKIDVFLKAIQKAPAKGAQVEIDNAWLDQNVKTALGWARFTVDEFKGRKNNKVAHYITNPKTDPYKTHAVATEAPAGGDDPDFA